MLLHLLRDETCELQLGVFFAQSRGLHALRLFPGLIVFGSLHPGAQRPATETHL